LLKQLDQNNEEIYQNKLEIRDFKEQILQLLKQQQMMGANANSDIAQIA
jgi:hypothetical protein